MVVRQNTEVAADGSRSIRGNEIGRTGPRPVHQEISGSVITTLLAVSEPGDEVWCSSRSSATARLGQPCQTIDTIGRHGRRPVTVGGARVICVESIIAAIPGSI